MEAALAALQEGKIACQGGVGGLKKMHDSLQNRSMQYILNSLTGWPGTIYIWGT